MKTKPIALIDDVLDNAEWFRSCQVEIDGKWYAAKPLPYYGIHNVMTRIRAAWAVLIGKAMAVQFKEDDDAR